MSLKSGYWAYIHAFQVREPSVLDFRDWGLPGSGSADSKQPLAFSA
ncbi:hypothetical protein [Bartonella raoultii]|nr:hypothetical protein [Bartonella raoultii]